MFLLRLLKILRVALHFGLDEFLLGHERLVGARTLLAKLLFWRKLEQPRGVRLRLALESLGKLVGAGVCGEVKLKFLGV